MHSKQVKDMSRTHLPEPHFWPLPPLRCPWPLPPMSMPSTLLATNSPSTTVPAVNTNCTSTVPAQLSHERFMMKHLVGMIKSARKYLLWDTPEVKTPRQSQASRGDTWVDGAHPKYAARKANDEQDERCSDSQDNLQGATYSLG